MDKQTDLGNGHVSVSQDLLDWTDAQRKSGITEPQIVSQLLRVADLIGRPERTPSEDGVLYDVTIENGKYRFVYKQGALPKAYRYGEPWNPFAEKMIGSNAIYALVARVAYLDEMLDMSARVVGTMIAVDTATPPVGSASLTAPVTEGEDGSLKVTAQVDVPMSRITDMLVGAIEGGSGYWCQQFLPLPASGDIVADIRANGGSIWYSEEQFWTRGGGAHVEFDKPTDEDPGFRDIGMDQLKMGLATMAQIAPRHFADLVNENDDAETSDVFLQCVLFGEIIFG